MIVQRFTVYRASGGSADHVEFSDLQGLLDWVRGTGEGCVVLGVEDGVAPSITIYDDYLE